MRVFRYVLWALLGLVVLALAGIGAGSVWLQGESGRRWLIATIERMAGTPDQFLRIGAIDGPIPFGMVLRDVTLSDGQGVWLDIDRARLAVDPGALPHRRLSVQAIEAGRIILARLPESRQPEPETSSEPFRLPELPVAIDLQHLMVDRLELGAPVTGGKPATVRITGAGRLGAAGDPLSARLNIARIDDQPGTADIALEFSPDSNRLDLDAAIAEPAGGMIAGLLGVPGQPPVALDLKGHGPLDNWQGRLTAGMGRDPRTADGSDIAKLAADAAIHRTDAGYRLILKADAEVARLLPLPAASLVAGSTMLNAEATYDPAMGRAALHPITLSTAAGTVTLTGSYDDTGKRLDATATLSMPQDSTARGLLPAGIGWQDVRLDATAQGPLLAPRLAATLSVRTPTAPGIRAERLDLELRANPTGPLTAPESGIALVANLTAAQPFADNAEMAALTGPSLQLAAGAMVWTGSGDIRIDSLTAQSATGTLSGEAVLQNWGARLDGQAQLAVSDLSRLAGLTGQPALAGTATLAAKVAQAPGLPVRADLTGTLRDLRTGIAEADALLQGAADLVGVVTRSEDGTLRLADLAVTARHVALYGEGAVQGDRLDSRIQLRLPDLAVLGTPLDAPYAGRVTLDATVTGPLDRLKAVAKIDGESLTLAGRPLGKATVEAEAAGLPATPHGTIKAHAELKGRGLNLNGTYGLTGNGLTGGRLDLTGLALTSGANRVTGTVQVALDSLTATGKLNGHLGELAGLSDLAGLPLHGQATIALDLDGRNGGQAATLRATAQGLRLSGADGLLFGARQIELNADLADVLTRPKGKTTLNMRDAQTAGATLTTVTARIDGNLDRAAFQATLDGAVQAGDPPRGGRPLSLDIGGTVAHDGTQQRIVLDKTSLSYGGEPFRLTGPATLTLGEQDMTVAGLEIRGRSARLALDAGIGARALKGTATLDRVPLDLVALVDPTLRLTGQLNATATLSGSLRDPRAEANIRIDNLKAPQAAQAGIEGINATMQAQWRNRRLSIAAQAATARQGMNVKATAELPLVLDAASHAVTLPDRDAVTGRLTGRIELARFNDLLATTGDRVNGHMDADLTLGGTLADPRLGGTVAIADALYQNQATGLVIKRANALLRGNGDSLTIERFSGDTVEGGPIMVAGRVILTPWAHDQLDVRITAGNARVLQTDIITANVDADLELDGTFTMARLTGQIGVQRAEVRIPDRMPPSVVELDVVEVGGDKGHPEQNRRLQVPVPGRKPPPVQEAPAAAPEDGGGPHLALNIAVSAQNQVYLRGRGLDAELGGDLKVAGSAVNPDIAGTLQMRRGQLDVLGKRFEFRRGEVRFTGGTGIDPELDLEAQAGATNLTAVVKVSGQASKPELELTSVPQLPNDEVLARVLFDKPVDRLSALEAVQLAQSAATLAGIGGGSGILDKVRQTIGIDRLEISNGAAGAATLPGTSNSPALSSLRPSGPAAATRNNGESTGSSGPALSAGRYVSDNVYVGVEQGLNPNSSRAKVEIDITDNIQAEADVGANSSTRFGLKFEWDY